MVAGVWERVLSRRGVCEDKRSRLNQIASQLRLPTVIPRAVHIQKQGISMPLTPFRPNPTPIKDITGYLPEPSEQAPPPRFHPAHHALVHLVLHTAGDPLPLPFQSRLPARSAPTPSSA